MTSITLEENRDTCLNYAVDADYIRELSYLATDANMSIREDGMIDATFIAVIVGFVGLLFTVLWSERRHDRRLSAIEGELSAVRIHLAEVGSEMKAHGERLERLDNQSGEMQQSIRSVSSKVDRAQGNLDVLVFGDRGVPEPVARERAAIEGRSEEAIAD